MQGLPWMGKRGKKYMPEKICELCIGKFHRDLLEKFKEMHKRNYISSFLFYNFALIYILGIFLLTGKWVFLL